MIDKYNIASLVIVYPVPFNFIKITQNFEDALEVSEIGFVEINDHRVIENDGEFVHPTAIESVTPGISDATVHIPAIIDTYKKNAHVNVGGSTIQFSDDKLSPYTVEKVGLVKLEDSVGDVSNFINSDVVAIKALGDGKVEWNQGVDVKNGFRPAFGFKFEHEDGMTYSDTFKLTYQISEGLGDTTPVVSENPYWETTVLEAEAVSAQGDDLTEMQINFTMFHTDYNEFSERGFSQTFPENFNLVTSDELTFVNKPTVWSDNTVGVFFNAKAGNFSLTFNDDRFSTAVTGSIADPKGNYVASEPTVQEFNGGVAYAFQIVEGSDVIELKDGKGEVVVTIDGNVQETVDVVYDGHNTFQVAITTEDDLRKGLAIKGTFYLGLNEVPVEVDFTKEIEITDHQVTVEDTEFSDNGDNTTDLTITYTTDADTLVFGDKLPAAITVDGVKVQPKSKEENVDGEAKAIVVYTVPSNYRKIDVANSGVVELDDFNTATFADEREIVNENIEVPNPDSDFEIALDDIIITPTNVVPVMNASEDEGFVAFSSSDWDSSRETMLVKPENIFDRNKILHWGQGNKQWPAAIGVQLPEAKTVKSYQFTNRTLGNVSNFVTAWTFEGSNDGENWDVLDTRTDTTQPDFTQMRYYDVETPGEYSYYRLNITNSSSSSHDVATLGDLYLFEEVKGEVTALEATFVYRLEENGVERSEGTIFIEDNQIPSLNVDGTNIKPKQVKVLDKHNSGALVLVYDLPVFFKTASQNFNQDLIIGIDTPIEVSDNRTIENDYVWAEKPLTPVVMTPENSLHVIAPKAVHPILKSGESIDGWTISTSDYRGSKPDPMFDRYPNAFSSGLIVGSNGTLTITGPEPFKVNAFTLVGPISGTQYPEVWSLSGSLDGKEWAEVGRWDSVPFTGIDQQRFCTLAKTEEYQYYRFMVQQSAGSQWNAAELVLHYIETESGIPETLELTLGISPPTGITVEELEGMSEETGITDDIVVDGVTISPTGTQLGGSAGNKYYRVYEVPVDFEKININKVGEYEISKDRKLVWKDVQEITNPGGWVKGPTTWIPSTLTIGEIEPMEVEAGVPNQVVGVIPVTFPGVLPEDADFSTLFSVTSAADTLNKSISAAKLSLETVIDEENSTEEFTVAKVNVIYADALPYAIRLRDSDIPDPTMRVTVKVTTSPTNTDITFPVIPTVEEGSVKVSVDHMTINALGSTASIYLKLTSESNPDLLFNGPAFPKETQLFVEGLGKDLPVYTTAPTYTGNVQGPTTYQLTARTVLEEFGDYPLVINDPSFSQTPIMLSFVDPTIEHTATYLSSTMDEENSLLWVDVQVSDENGPVDYGNAKIYTKTGDSVVVGGTGLSYNPYLLRAPSKWDGKNILSFSVLINAVTQRYVDEGMEIHSKIQLGDATSSATISLVNIDIVIPPQKDPNEADPDAEYELRFVENAINEDNMSITYELYKDGEAYTNEKGSIPVNEGKPVITFNDEEMPYLVGTGWNYTVTPAKLVLSVPLPEDHGDNFQFGVTGYLLLGSNEVQVPFEFEMDNRILETAFTIKDSEGNVISDESTIDFVEDGKATVSAKNIDGNEAIALIIGEDVIETTVDEDGNLSASFDLVAGDYIVTLDATDLNGNHVSEGLTFTVNEAVDEEPVETDPEEEE